MKLRTVGLVGLVLAHMGAAALPNPCLKSHREANRKLTETLGSLEGLKTGATWVGTGGGLVALIACGAKLRSGAALVACPIVFLGIYVVAHGYAGELQSKQTQAMQAAYIYQLYVTAKSGGDSRVVRLMDEGQLCDGKGRPNKSLDQVFELIKTVN